MASVVFSPTLCLVGGVVVDVPTQVCRGGVYGALEMGRALASYSRRLRLGSRLYSGLCKNACIVKRCVRFEHSLCLFCIIVWGGASVGVELVRNAWSVSSRWRCDGGKFVL